MQQATGTTDHTIATPSTSGINARFKIDYDPATLRQYFDRPLEEAAKALGTCSATLKRVCRRQNISHWPYRSLCAKANTTARTTPPVKRTTAFTGGSCSKKRTTKQVVTRTVKRHAKDDSSMGLTSSARSCAEESACTALVELLRVASEMQTRLQSDRKRELLFPLEQHYRPIAAPNRGALPRPRSLPSLSQALESAKRAVVLWHEPLEVESSVFRTNDASHLSVLESPPSARSSQTGADIANHNHPF